MFFKLISRHIFNKIPHTLQFTGGGSLKRVDENRELLELLQAEAPEFLINNPQVISWLKCNDEVFVDLALISKQLCLRELFVTNEGFPRPWPNTKECKDPSKLLDSDQDLSLIGERLIAERNRLSISQGRLAELCGIERTRQHLIEHGIKKLDADYLSKIGLLGFNINYVLNGVN